eukprot:CAMPEP_0179156372 /NCGR_PEP_ID=MMETSP0796-20121207/76228_1 /TAXON_ID=73915 /ORGANISM="Pyrodinium bahamense, Strain pbaha01" /LENGTH=69 /DNA_ID=CAMNT_0020857945 /DNA_START=24 /DNA_END=229 /DNA_ORIENTATION=+
MARSLGKAIGLARSSKGLESFTPLVVASSGTQAAWPEGRKTGERPTPRGRMQAWCQRGLTCLLLLQHVA